MWSTGSVRHDSHRARKSTIDTWVFPGRFSRGALGSLRSSWRLLDPVMAGIKNSFPSALIRMRADRCLSLPRWRMRKTLTSEVDDSDRAVCVAVCSWGERERLVRGGREVVGSQPRVEPLRPE
jgi:hypothetical protein